MWIAGIIFRFCQIMSRRKGEVFLTLQSNRGSFHVVFVRDVKTTYCPGIAAKYHPGPWAADRASEELERFKLAKEQVTALGHPPPRGGGAGRDSDQPPTPPPSTIPAFKPERKGCWASLSALSPSPFPSRPPAWGGEEGACQKSVSVFYILGSNSHIYLAPITCPGLKIIIPPLWTRFAASRINNKKVS